VTAVLLVLMMVSVLAAISVRDHRRLRASRTSLFDDAAAALDTPKITHGGDGFPKLRGRYNGFEVHADLIPDTMVVRRLPQLWLSVTLLAPDRGLPGFGVLVRYAGNEFYSLTTEFKHRLEPPPGLPREVLIRAEKPEAQSLLDELRQPLARLLSDPQVKEVAITAKGLRIVRQAAEGRRGDHLLLRQATFDTAGIALGELQTVLAELNTLQFAISKRSSARAA
jgi:hypothetical protein